VLILQVRGDLEPEEKDMDFVLFCFQIYLKEIKSFNRYNSVDLEPHHSDGALQTFHDAA
jgi:hypothetical protein